MKKLTEEELCLIRSRFFVSRDFHSRYTPDGKEEMMEELLVDMQKLIYHVEALQDELDGWRTDWAARRIIRNPNGTPG